MTQSTQTIGSLRQRMIDDMRLRKLSAKTQTGYIRAVRGFAGFMGGAPDTANAEDLRRYQLHLVEQGMSSGSLNATITGLKFFFEITLEHPEVMTKMSHVYEPRKLPVILSLEEVTRLLQAVGGPKYQAALGVAYGAGLRANEVVHLTASDIDSERDDGGQYLGRGGGGPAADPYLEPFLQDGDRVERERRRLRIPSRIRQRGDGHRPHRGEIGRKQPERSMERDEHRPLGPVTDTAPRLPPGRAWHRCRLPGAEDRGEDAAILAARKRLYEAAKQARPERWSGDTRNWTPINEVWLNPPRDLESESSAEKKVA